MIITLENRVIRLTAFFLISLGFTLFSSGNPFFWDSVVQVSLPANWYYDNNFTSFFIPDEIATGHPNLVGMYLAGLWKILGKNLLVSHLAMLPFIFGIFVQLYNLVKMAGLNLKDSLLTLILVLCDATLVAQMSMITFDIPHIFFFLLCLNTILAGRRGLFSIAFAFLLLTSLRGALSGIGILLFSLFNDTPKSYRTPAQKLKPFVPGLILFFLHFMLFYFEKGWIIFNPASSSYGHFTKLASVPELIRNIAVAGWRLADFGRAGIWLIFSCILIISFKNGSFTEGFLRQIVIIVLYQLLIFIPVIAIFRNPSGHRYFLPVIIPVALLVSAWVMKYFRYKYCAYAILLLLTISGYFLVYPTGIATGWDATPAHWPYFRLRNEIMVEIKDSGISADGICSFFPNISGTKVTDLVDCGLRFSDYETRTDCKYILYSNVCNLSDSMIDELYRSGAWSPVISKRRCLVSIILFKKVN